MGNLQRTRRQQLLREAEGYLDLLLACSERGVPAAACRDQLAQRALEVLGQLDPPAHRRSQTLLLRGQALRLMDRFTEALLPLEEASKIDPENLQVWLALGWCYKRTGRLDLAIQALEEALTADPHEALVYYNLACYWSLANNPKLSVAYLARAFELDAAYRELVGAEADFDPIRQHPHFLALTSVIV